MFLERLKQAMKESYVGAIALGWLFAQAVMQFVDIFVTPVGAWVSQQVYPGLRAQTGGPQGISFQLGLPELIRFVLVLAIWYALVRWLYFGPSDTEVS